MWHSSRSNKQNTHESDLLAEINIIPLVDVMLVMLIIFMVTAPLSLTTIKVNLPTSKSTNQDLSESPMILSIDDQGRYFLGKIIVERKTLQQRLNAIFANRGQKILYIHADKSIKYGEVIKAMSAAKSAGVEKISMMTKSSKSG